MTSLSILQIIITIIASFAGSTVLSTVGFGIGMVGIPILLLALDPQTAVVVLNTVTTPLLVLIVWKNRAHVQFRETLPIGILGLLGALTGAYILSNTDDTILRISIVVFIIALTIASAFDIRGKVVKGREPQGTIEPDRYEAVRDELKAKFEAMTDHEGHPLGTKAHKPQEIYRAVRAKKLGVQSSERQINFLVVVI